MDQLRQLFERFTIAQRITLGLTVVAVFAGILMLSRWNKERDFRPVFTNLAPDDAAQVVTRLRESGVEYRLGENGTTILVPSAQVAEMRLQLASAGLPKSGRLGFELFDKANFGATDFTEQINYHRALEGELERSVMALSAVEQARIHITFPKDSIYLESKQPAKASVMVKLRPGAKLTPGNVVAICHLTASAVETLLPESVSVLDMNGNLLNRPRRPGAGDELGSEAALDYKQQVERSILAKINTTLEPLLGSDRFRAGVSVDCDITSGEQSEETFDPSKSVMMTSQRTEDGTTASLAAGVPGTPSALPRPTSRPSSGSGGTSRRTENISYQSSRLVKHVKLPQGAVRRISVSVLLDQPFRFDKGKKIIEPPSADKLKIVKDLVAGVAGIVTDRDQVIVETFPFESTLRAEPPSAEPASPVPAGPSWGPPWLRQLMAQKNFALMAGGAGGVLVLLMLGIVILLLKAARRKPKVEVTTVPAVGAGAKPAEIGGIDPQKQLEVNLAEQAAIKEQQAREVLNSLKLPAVTTKKTEVLVKHIGAEARKDPLVMAQVIRSLVNNNE